MPLLSLIPPFHKLHSCSLLFLQSSTSGFCNSHSVKPNSSWSATTFSGPIIGYFCFQTLQNHCFCAIPHHGQLFLQITPFPGHLWLSPPWPPPPVPPMCIHPSISTYRRVSETRGAIHIWSLIIIVRGCPGHCRIFSSIPDIPTRCW